MALYVLAGMTMAIVFLAKDTSVGTDGVMTTRDGTRVSVENPGFHTGTSGGAIVSADSTAPPGKAIFS